MASVGGHGALQEVYQVMNKGPAESADVGVVVAPSACE